MGSGSLSTCIGYIPGLEDEVVRLECCIFPEKRQVAAYI
jgi:hypothetical protein